MNITWDNIFLAIQIVVTIQLLFGILLNLFEFRRRNILLAFVCLLIIYTYNIFFLYTITLNDYLQKPLHLILSYIYFGPTLYLYLKSLTTNTRLSNNLLIKHYLLPIILCTTYNIFNYKLYGLIVNTFTVVYFIASLKLFKSILSNLQTALKIRFKWFFIITSIYIILDTPMLIIEDLAVLKTAPFVKIYPIINDLFYKFLHFPLILFHFFILSVYAITEIPHFKKYFVSISLMDSGITQNKVEQLKQNLDTLLLKEKIYLNPDLTLAMLSKKLNIEKSILSKFLKENYNKGFNSIINSYRVEEFKNLLKEGKLNNYDLVGLGKESGFKSKATLYRVFKEIVGKTPNEYKNEL